MQTIFINTPKIVHKPDKTSSLFLERFKGKIRLIDKAGHIGVIENSTIPIQKTLIKTPEIRNPKDLKIIKTPLSRYNQYKFEQNESTRNYNIKKNGRALSIPYENAHKLINYYGNLQSSVASSKHEINHDILLPPIYSFDTSLCENMKNERRRLANKEFSEKYEQSVKNKLATLRRSIADHKSLNSSLIENIDKKDSFNIHRKNNRQLMRSIQISPKEEQQGKKYPMLRKFYNELDLD